MVLTNLLHSVRLVLLHKAFYQQCLILQRPSCDRHPEGLLVDTRPHVSHSLPNKTIFFRVNEGSAHIPHNAPGVITALIKLSSFHKIYFNRLLMSNYYEIVYVFTTANNEETFLQDFLIIGQV